jgi:hypothetical protein
VGAAVLLYLGASVLSLSSLPWDAIVSPEAFAPSRWIASMRATAAAIPHADVLDPLYAVLTVCLTLNAATIAALVAVLTRAGDSAGPRFLQSLAVGGLGASLVGLLDFFRVIDLRGLRAYDPFTNPTGRERLQGTFGHSGWFAQYICFTAPAGLWVLRWPLRRPLGALLLFLGVLGAAVVFSNQRGAWLTFAAVVCWAGYWSAALGHRDGDESRAKVLGLGLAHVALLLLVVAGVTVFLNIGVARSFLRLPSHVGDRLETLFKATDRTRHIEAAARLGVLVPVLGGGSETFAYRYQQEYLRIAGRYYQKGHSPLRDMYSSAHNVFAQTFAGKGGLGLAALVLMIIAAAASCARAVASASPGGRRVFAAAVGGIVLAFALYGMVQEVFYIPVLQLVVFAAFGLAAGLTGDAGNRDCSRVVPVVLLVGLIAHLTTGYVSPGHLRAAFLERHLTRVGSRLGPPEVDSQGGYFQRIGKRAILTVPVYARECSFEIKGDTRTPQQVQVLFDGRIVDNLQVTSSRWQRGHYACAMGGRPPRHLELRPTTGSRGASEQGGLMVRKVYWGEP